MNTARIIVLITALGAGEVAADPARAAGSNSLPFAPFAQLIANVPVERVLKRDKSIEMTRYGVLNSATTDANKGCPT